MTTKPAVRIDWRGPVGLVILSLIPVLAGMARLLQLSTGEMLKADDARFFASPIPVTLHIIAASLYALLGALQFVPQLRGRRPWHRTMGWLVLLCGFLTALTGLWMTQVYLRIPTDSVMLYATRLLVGGAMLLSLTLAVVAVKQRSYKVHGDWMIRAYALGQGAGTQVLTHLPWFLLVGEPGPTSRASLMALAWAINLAVAEWIIRSQGPRRL